MKTALVTGGTSGIGLAIVSRLISEGYQVFTTSSQSTEAGEKLAAQFEYLHYRRADVTNEAAMKEIVAEIQTSEGGLDVLVNNAGYTEVIAHGDLDRATDEVWDRILRTNLMGTWWTIRAARELLSLRSGVIINISSIAGLRAEGSSVPYAVSKAAINHLTVLLAASIEGGIRVNAIAPGLVDTPWTAEWEQVRQKISARAPLGRIAEPGDIAEAVMGVIAAKYMTGQVIAVDGGWTARR